MRFAERHSLIGAILLFLLTIVPVTALSNLAIPIALESADAPTPEPTYACIALDAQPRYNAYDLNNDGQRSSIDLMCQARQGYGPNPAPTATPTPQLPTPANEPTPSATDTPEAQSRDPLLWPFATTSIWNMPIGSNAVYVPANIAYAGAWRGEITYDEEYICTDTGAPVRSYRGMALHVCGDLEHDGSWNGCATFIRDDATYLGAGQPLVLSPGGTPSWQYDYSTPGQTIYGDGRWGCHGGSAMSGLGGSIRPGEISGPDPIRHALKVNLYAKRFLSCTSGGYRWPAFRADAYMSCSTYGGSVPPLRMGALLAIHPDADCATFAAASSRKLCHALQDYGAYVVDDTAWDVHAIDLDVRAVPELRAVINHAEVQRLFQMLYVVDNNGPLNIGGGGTPRAPLAPLLTP